MIVDTIRDCNDRKDFIEVEVSYGTIDIDSYYTDHYKHMSIQLDINGVDRLIRALERAKKVLNGDG